MIKKILPILLLCVLFAQCDFINDVYREIPVRKHKLNYTSQDCRAFQGTPAWGLAIAVDDNDTAEIINILKKQPDLIDYGDPVWGYTVLMQSIKNKHYEAFLTLLRLGADVQIHNMKYGSSAIHAAVETEDVRYVEAVLHHGGNIDDYGKGCRRIYDRIGWIDTPLILAVRDACYGEKDMTIVKYLIDHGADPNIYFGYERSALQESLFLGNFDLAIYLIESGANYMNPFVHRPKVDTKDSTVWVPVSIQQYLDECKGIIPTNYGTAAISDSQYNRLTELISQPYVPKPITRYHYDESNDKKR